jgi:hypothetical protein
LTLGSSAGDQPSDSYSFGLKRKSNDLSAHVSRRPAASITTQTE